MIVKLHSLCRQIKRLNFELVSRKKKLINSVDIFVCVCALSHVLLFVTPWTVAFRAPLSMEFSRQEY